MTILQIGGLLQVGFGEAGAVIIGNNMSSGDGELNIMMPGRRVIAVLGYADVVHFTHLTDCLREDVMLYLNTISHIVHTCAVRWSGLANRNLGDGFLVLWKMPEAGVQGSEMVGMSLTMGTGDLATRRSAIADRALISFVKIIAECRRSPDINRFLTRAKQIRLAADQTPIDFRPEVGLGLHVGWAIEAPIGSDFKIDASYLSPHVNITMLLENATRMYGVPMLLSETFYALLSLRAKERVRKVDVVTIAAKPQGLFTFTMHNSVLEAPEGHNTGDIIKPEQLEDVPVEEIEGGSGAEFLWLIDQDIVVLQESIEENLLSFFRQGLCSYVDGDWTKAQELLQQALAIAPDDGPTKSLLTFMESFGFRPPQDWIGSRGEWQPF
mmetsp:Transcript_20010/g.42977  ORF Transcript_20010/g.42977 Transcript_20010/m.42977 type:complete len:382 (-) Transcript_20010:127-1272(-)